MPVDLLTLIPNEETRRLHYFNGRLLSGEDLTAEQEWHRAMHELLGRAVGDGVVQGLEVALVPESSTPQVPVLRVSRGFALNRGGEALVVDQDVDVRLTVDPAHELRRITGPPVFSECTPPQETAFLTDSGIYVLTLCSKTTGEGTTPFGGFGDLPRRCNIRWVIDAVAFRLVPVTVPLQLLSDLSYARNLVAHELLGLGARAAWAADPAGGTQSPALLDRSTNFTACDVPLAVIYWTAAGLQFVDMWAVRRRCATGTGHPEEAVWSPRTLAVAEAAQHQFDEHLRDVAAIAADPRAVEARDHFRYLPPAGMLPVTNGPVRRFEIEAFFAGMTALDPVYVEAADVHAVFRAAADAPPIDVASREFIRLYTVRANRQTIEHGGAGVPRHYVLFTSGDLPFFAWSRFHRSHFNYSNFV